MHFIIALVYFRLSAEAGRRSPNTMVTTMDMLLDSNGTATPAISPSQTPLPPLVAFPTGYM